MKSTNINGSQTIVLSEKERVRILQEIEILSLQKGERTRFFNGLRRLLNQSKGEYQILLHGG